MVTEHDQTPETKMDKELQQSPFSNQVLVTDAEDTFIAINSDLLTLEILNDVVSLLDLLLI